MQGTYRLHKPEKHHPWCIGVDIHNYRRKENHSLRGPCTRPWYLFPRCDVAYEELYVGMENLPVREHKKQGNINSVDLTLAKIAFKMDPDDPTKMLVIDLSGKHNRHAEATRAKNSETDGFDYPAFEWKVYAKQDKIFQVSLGTRLDLVTILFKFLRGNTKSDGPTRVKLDYGCVNTISSWNEVYDVKGTIGASTGDKKAFLLIPTARSMGGGAILTDCIISIDETRKSTAYSAFSGPRGIHRNHFKLSKMFTNPLRKITGL